MHFPKILVQILKKFGKHISKFFSKAEKIQKTRSEIFIQGKKGRSGYKRNMGW
jgi:hypothetical protein